MPLVFRALVEVGGPSPLQYVNHAAEWLRQRHAGTRR
jgi:hypothetical protein